MKLLTACIRVNDLRQLNNQLQIKGVYTCKNNFAFYKRWSKHVIHKKKKIRAKTEKEGEKIEKQLQFLYKFWLSSIKHCIYFFLACPKIAHCLEMHCYDTAASTICANCEGVVKGAPYYRAYKKSDDRKQCLRMLKHLLVHLKRHIVETFLQENKCFNQDKYQYYEHKNIV